MFDIRFTRFITDIWISIIWVAIIINHFIGAIIAMYYIDDMLCILAVPLITFMSLIFCRMVLELVAIFFRIETNTRESKEHLREIKELLSQK